MPKKSKKGHQAAAEGYYQEGESRYVASLPRVKFILIYSPASWVSIMDLLTTHSAATLLTGTRPYKQADLYVLSGKKRQRSRGRITGPERLPREETDRRSIRRRLRARMVMVNTLVDAIAITITITTTITIAITRTDTVHITAIITTVQGSRDTSGWKGL
ncbi:hypothetical protein F4861DRAFT_543641 [Xylaria intraflava]|nr:hypothetical protein F4861DRAFT_543641 [Xylaria intraflava]